MHQSLKPRSLNEAFVRAMLSLVVASLFVAVSILIEGAAARAINGIGGLMWITSSIFLIRSLRLQPQFPIRFGVVFTECLILVLLLKPSNLAWAIVGFALGGTAIALFVGDRGLHWALLLPAIWLPVHLLVAVAKVAYRATTGAEAVVRTDPPPTAALVPLAMVVAALLGAWAVDWVRARTSNPSSRSAPSKT